MSPWVRAIRWKRHRHALARHSVGGSVYCGHGYVANLCPVETVLRREPNPQQDSPSPKGTTTNGAHIHVRVTWPGSPQHSSSSQPSPTR